MYIRLTNPKIQEVVLIHHHYDHHHHHHLLLLLLLLHHHLVFLLVIKIFVDVGDFFPIKLGMIFVHLILYPMDEHLTRNEDTCIRNRDNGLEHLTRNEDIRNRDNGLEHQTRNEDIRNRDNGLEHLALGMRILGMGTMD